MLLCANATAFALLLGSCRVKNGPTCAFTHLAHDPSGTDPIFGAYTAFSQRATAVTRTVRCYAKGWASVQLTLASPTHTNWMSPATFYGTMHLTVPQDSDLLATYGTAGIVSSYVTSTDAAPPGTPPGTDALILGFIDHRLWKTGFRVALPSSATTHRYPRIEAVVGLNGIQTRDVLIPHGSIIASTSPTLAIIPYEGSSSLRLYAKLCGLFEGAPPPPPKRSVGWNSWAITVSGKGAPSVEMLTAASALLASDASIMRDAVYSLNASETQVWVDAVRAKGQAAGTYFAPFAHFGESNASITCAGETWERDETLLTDAQSGKPLRPLSNEHNFIRDVTHPSMKCVLKAKVAEAERLGFTALKMDFLNYAAYEGQRFDMAHAPTGMAAYNFALDLIAEVVPAHFRLNYGIAPTLPAGKRAHARHAGNDQMFGAVRFMMNELKGGFWLSELVRQDPDLITLVGDFAYSPALPHTGMDAIARIAKAIAFSGVYKNGDDLSNATTLATVAPLLTHTGFMGVWNKSGYFDPTPEAESEPMLETWIRTHVEAEADVIIFNYGHVATKPAEKRFGKCVDVYTGGAWGGVVAKKSASILSCELH